MPTTFYDKDGNPTNGSTEWSNGNAYYRIDFCRTCYYGAQITLYRRDGKCGDNYYWDVVNDGSEEITPSGAHIGFTRKPGGSLRGFVIETSNEVFAKMVAHARATAAANANH